jgi:predicted AAA+ superfamily ATPase
VSDKKEHPSISEMWKVIESVGIKKEEVEKIFTTDKSVLELYDSIEKRIHYQREQDMIKRLQEYVEKLKQDEIEKSVKKQHKKN